MPETDSENHYGRDIRGSPCLLRRGEDDNHIRQKLTIKP